MAGLWREVQDFLTKGPTEYADDLDRRLKREATVEVTTVRVVMLLDREQRWRKRLDKRLRRLEDDLD